jgi:hypothetical protein
MEMLVRQREVVTLEYLGVVVQCSDDAVYVTPEFGCCVGLGNKTTSFHDLVIVGPYYPSVCGFVVDGMSEGSDVEFRFFPDVCSQCRMFLGDYFAVVKPL